MKLGPITIAVCMMLALAGCQLELREVRGKTKFGPAFRHKGSNRTDRVRWTAQQGIQFKWKKGINTTVTYRRRDVDDGTGSNDNAVFFSISYPLWEAKKASRSDKKRIKRLEKRLKRLEALKKEEDGR